jgi:hypothetical protein
MAVEHSLKASGSKVESSHYKGGVASAAFEHFDTLEADDFKFESLNEKKTLKEGSQRGRPVKNGRKILDEAKPAKNAHINMILDKFSEKAAASSKKLQSLRSD